MSGSISFKYFPQTTWRVPGFYGEFDASNANTALPVQRALLIGQVLPSGTAAATGPGGTYPPMLAYAQDQVTLACGANSMLALMYQAYRQQDAYGEVYLLPYADSSTGVVATASLVVSGPATAAGTLSLYIAGILVSVPVNNGDSASVIAGSIVSTMALTAGLSCTASASSATVTLTSLHKGATQNDIDLRLNYRAVRNAEVTPPGVSVAITPFANGANNPALNPTLANLGTTTFDFIAVPYTDSASMAAVAGLLSDQTGRWSAQQGLYGHAFYAYRGTAGQRATFGLSQNNQHQTILAYYDSPTPAWLEAADWAGAHAAILRTNPAIGVVGQPLAMLAPPIASRDTTQEMQSLLTGGLSTYTVDAAGQCRIGRSITTYQSNAAGQVDDSYLNTNLLFQAMYVVRYFQINIMTQYQNKIVVDDGAIIGAGSPATTPSLVFQAVCGMYAYLASQFVVQNPLTFAKNGYGKKGQKGQVLLYLPLDFADQVIQVAALMSFVQST